MPTDTVTIPLAAICIACGVAGEYPCARCGLTESDARHLLRHAARCYSAAREQALRGHYIEASAALGEAARLGLATQPAFQELQHLLQSIDPAVPWNGAAHYVTVREAALRGSFPKGLVALLDTPASRELVRLCDTGRRLQTRAHRQRLLIGTTLVVLLIGCFTGIYMGIRPPARPAPSKNEGTMVNADASPVPVPVATKPSVASSFRGEEGADYPFPERLARRYFNDALEANRLGKYRTAARLAEAAANVGKGTYFLPEALLLRAQIADTIQEKDAARRWAKIAREAPGSPYAPLGLLQAAERARAHTGSTQTTASYLRELYRRYPASYETRQARKRFTIGNGDE